MDGNAKYYAAATAVFAVAFIAALLLLKKELIDIIPQVFFVIFYPLIILGLYLYLEGKGHRWINGPDWGSMNDTEIRNTVSYIGAFLMIGMVLMSASMVFIIDNVAVFVVLLILSIVLILLPMVRLKKAGATPFRERSGRFKIGAFIAVSLISLAPVAAYEFTDHNSSAVKVEFGENGFILSAPCVDETFDYSGIKGLTLDPDFDKGTRIWGYSTPTIYSGEFRNDAFGNYTLASYTQVDPCVFFEYEGDYYAFNQSTDELTQKVYEDLLSRL